MREIFRLYPQVLPLILVTIFAQLGSATISIFILPYYLDEQLGFSITVIGLIFSTFLIVETAFKVPCGTLSDRIGRKPLILLGPCISALSALLMVRVRSALAFFLLRGLDGFAAAALWPAIFASVGDLVDVKRRATAMSIFYNSYLAGIVLGPAMGGVLVKVSGSAHLPFYLVSFLFAVSGVCGWVGLVGKEMAPASVRAEVVRSSSGRGSQRIPVVIAIILLGMFGLFMLHPSGIIYANRELGVNQSRIGLLFLLPALPLVVLAMPLGRLGDKWGKPKAFKIGFLVIALGIWCLPLARNFLELSVILIAVGVGFLIAAPALLAYITELSSRERRGAMVGLASSAEGLGAIFGPAVGGHLYEQLGRGFMYCSASLITLTALLAIMLIGQE